MYKSLLEDAEQLNVYVEDVLRTKHEGDHKYIARIYLAMYDKYESTKNYPVLHRVAWRMLYKTVSENNIVLLKEIDDIYKTLGIYTDELPINKKISYWHIKAFLYVWLYVNNVEDLDTRRPIEDVDALINIIKEHNLFINLTPDEASRKLQSYRLSHINTLPYLFRISTTELGTITWSGVTISSKIVKHMRSHHSNIKRLVKHGMVSVLLNDLLPKDELLTFKQIANVLPNIDPEIKTKPLVKEINGKQIARRNVYSIVKKIYFKNDTILQLVPQTPEEKIGVTISYFNGYVVVIEDPSILSCVHCLTSRATLIGKHTNAPYCSLLCYKLDFNKFY